MTDSLYQYLLTLGDNSTVLGHRLSELCGHGPNLETDIALTNISLDLFGQVRSLYQYAAKLKGGEATEDSIAFLRFDRDFRNVILVEQPNTDFAHVIGRQFLFDAFQVPLLEQLTQSQDETIAAIATKSLKEALYHLRFSSEWVKRLGDGTKLSKEKMQAALDHLFPFVHELFVETPVETEMKTNGIGADLALVKKAFEAKLAETLYHATLQKPTTPPRQANGKSGIHTEELGHILSQFQFMQRAYPNMQW